MDDLVQTQRVLWNGEDIFMSLVSAKLTGNLPLILPRTANELVSLDEGSAGLSAHHTHYPHRSAFLKTAMQRLANVTVRGRASGAASAF